MPDAAAGSGARMTGNGHCHLAMFKSKDAFGHHGGNMKRHNGDADHDDQEVGMKNWIQCTDLS